MREEREKGRKGNGKEEKKEVKDLLRGKIEGNRICMSLILSGGKVDSRNEVTGTLVGHRYTGFLFLFCSHWLWIF